MSDWYTVKKLIKVLEKFNPDAEILIGVDGSISKWIGIFAGIDSIDYDHEDFMKCEYVQLHSTEITKWLKEINYKDKIYNDTPLGNE
tara:strand:+ start:353 stop:613 length:261 start_codon:yes stop_codon:yes gene_type:complete